MVVLHHLTSRREGDRVLEGGDTVVPERTVMACQEVAVMEDLEVAVAEVTLEAEVCQLGNGDEGKGYLIPGMGVEEGLEGRGREASEDVLVEPNPNAI